MSIAHKRGKTAMIWRSDGTRHSGPRNDYTTRRQSSGGPIQIGDAEALGICDINNPEYGAPVTIEAGEIPVFWACGVTPQEAILIAKPRIAITHAPGYMFVSDLLSDAGKE